VSGSEISCARSVSFCPPTQQINHDILHLCQVKCEYCTVDESFGLVWFLEVHSTGLSMIRREPLEVVSPATLAVAFCWRNPSDAALSDK